MSSRRWAVLAVLLAVIGTFIALQSVSSGRGADPQPVPPAPGPPPPVALGVTTQSLAANASAPWRPGDLVEVNRFERQARQHMDIVMWFADWERSRFDARQAAAIARRRAVPEIAWEPWDATVGGSRPQPRYRLARIVAGRYDGYIRRFARAVARYDAPVRIRFAQEMNGTWYPWAERHSGNRPGEFVRAWRHVHRIFARAGASNVTWIWAPVTGTITRRIYPGDKYVDVVGLSGFNGGRVLYGRGWRSFRAAFSRGLDAVERLAPGKPVEIAEVASTEHGGDKAAWIRGMFDEIRRRRSIRAVVWFNLDKETDWRISSSVRARRAYAAGAAELRAAGR